MYVLSPFCTSTEEETSSNEAEANPSASARTTTFPAVTDERNNARFTPHSTGSFSDKI